MYLAIYVLVKAQGIDPTICFVHSIQVLFMYICVSICAYIHTIILYNRVLPPTPSIIGCSYISRLPNKLSYCCLYPWKMLPASLEAADACTSGHTVQGFGPERESNINQTAGHNLDSQDDNFLHGSSVLRQ